MLGSGFTSNYIIDQVARSFDLIIQLEEGSEQLTLVDGSKVQALGYISFWLQCGQYNNEVIALVFPKMH